MYKILFKKSAEKELTKLPSSSIKKISLAIDSLANNPRPNGSKKLVSQKETLWRIRVGDYRIIIPLKMSLKFLRSGELDTERTSILNLFSFAFKPPF